MFSAESLRDCGTHLLFPLVPGKSGNRTGAAGDVAFLARPWGVFLLRGEIAIQRSTWKAVTLDSIRVDSLSIFASQSTNGRDVRFLHRLVDFLQLIGLAPFLDCSRRYGRGVSRASWSRTLHQADRQTLPNVRELTFSL